MKNLNIFIVIIVISMTSCTEVIDLDLNSSDPQIVVEANLGADKNAIIKLTESVNFDDSNIFPEVENAIVTISDSQGTSEVLSEVSPGLYQTTSLTGKINSTYTLLIEANGKSMNSTCAIPQQVSFDSLIVEEGSGGGGFMGGATNTNYDVFVMYKDPPDEENYYRFVEYVNGEINGSYVFDDRMDNGLEIERPLLNFNRILDSGDTLQVEMQCVDKSVYEYFNSFGNLEGGPGNSSTPANPYSNIEGGKLGYFSAHTNELKQAITP